MLGVDLPTPSRIVTLARCLAPRQTGSGEKSSSLAFSEFSSLCTVYLTMNTREFGEMVKASGRLVEKPKRAARKAGTGKKR